jgi:hypothetical protein
MTYFLILKSGTDYPDLEDEVEATTKEVAIDYFKAHYSWLDKDIIEKGVFDEFNNV